MPSIAARRPEIELPEEDPSRSAQAVQTVLEAVAPVAGASAQAQAGHGPAESAPVAEDDEVIEATTVATTSAEPGSLAQPTVQSVLELAGAGADPMLSCRIILHLVEGAAGCCACLALLSASKRWNPDTWGRWFFVLCMMSVAVAKGGFSMHMAYMFSAADRGNFGPHALVMKALWKRSVGLFPALSVTLGGCYLLSACFSIIEASSGEAGMKGGGAGLVLFLYLSLFLYSALLFMESYTAPKRLHASAEVSAVQNKVALPPPPPSGRIRTGRYGKLVPSGAEAEAGTSFSTCSICLDCFQPTDEAARLPCGHIFHSDCLREWLRVRLQCPFRCAVALGGGMPFGAGAGGQQTQQSRDLARVQRQQRERETLENRSSREYNWRVSASARGTWDPDV